MEILWYFIFLLGIFAMVVVAEIFKLKKEVRKLNKIINFLLKDNKSSVVEN
tara:strand:- start:926 stop:1078 length:153 start_codon:yes stop_codon:yes gene_type:complete